MRLTYSDGKTAVSKVGKRHLYESQKPRRYTVEVRKPEKKSPAPVAVDADEIASGGCDKLFNDEVENGE